MGIRTLALSDEMSPNLIHVASSSLGETSTLENVRAFLKALGRILNDLGRKVDVDAALEAAG